MDAPTRSYRHGAPEPIGDVLARYLGQSGLLRPRAQRRLANAWCEAVGGDVAEHTRLVGFRRQVLEVVVDSAPRLHELANFHKAGILLRLRDALGSTYVRDIRFRPGPMAADEVSDT